MSKIITRGISISTNSSTIIGVNKTVTTSQNIQNVQKLAHNQEIDTPKLTPIDSSILSVELPPSIPITFNRGSLISIYGIGNMSLSSVKKTLYPTADYFKWKVYEQIIATSKISLLLTANQKSIFNINKMTNTKSMSVLTLDGTTDWAILKGLPSFIVGNSIILKIYRKPLTISRKLSKQLNLPRSTKTGLFKWYDYGYRLVTGRGQIGVTGKGSIYNINLIENEEILIDRRNLLAITVNGPHDLQNCIRENTIKPIEKVDGTDVVLKINDLVKKTKVDAKAIMDYITSFFKKLTNWTKSKTTAFNPNFVKVLGPRNLLIQSDTNFKVPEIPIDSISTDLKNFQAKSNDYLNYVNLKTQSVESTKDFKKA